MSKNKRKTKTTKKPQPKLILFHSFARHVLNTHVEDGGSGTVLLDVTVHVVTLREILATYQSQFRQVFLRIFYERNPSEANHASHMVPPVVRLLHGLVDYGKADLVASFQGIHLVAFQSTVEIDVPVGIHEIDRDGVWIPAFANDGEETAIGLFQNCFAFLVRKLLLESAHGSEFHYEMILSPTIERINVLRKNTRQNVAGS